MFSTWTDNIYIMENHIAKADGLDGESLESLRRESHGNEFVEGEGLPYSANN